MKFIPCTTDAPNQMKKKIMLKYKIVCLFFSFFLFLFEFRINTNEIFQVKSSNDNWKRDAIATTL